MNKIKTLPKVPFEGYWIYTGNPFKVVSCRNGCYCLEESGLRSGTLEHNYILEENLLDMYNKGDIALYSEKDEVVELALRYNEGKPELSYVLDVMPALKDMVEVMEFGADKYERNNWQKGFPKEKLIDSLLRHLDAFYSGEDIDPESGKPHIGHILCNAAFLGYHFGSNSQYWKDKYEKE